MVSKNLQNITKKKRQDQSSTIFKQHLQLKKEKKKSLYRLQ